ncbi:protein of unknown function [Agreia sp. COWG]|nr:protein of unknown function [Agreia sp. COWG]
MYRRLRLWGWSYILPARRRIHVGNERSYGCGRHHLRMRVVLVTARRRYCSQLGQEV